MLSNIARQSQAKTAVTLSAHHHAGAMPLALVCPPIATRTPRMNRARLGISMRNAAFGTWAPNNSAPNGDCAKLARSVSEPVNPEVGAPAARLQNIDKNTDGGAVEVAGPLQAWHVNTPEQAEDAARALLSTLGNSSEQASQKAQLTPELAAHITEQIQTLAAQNLMLFFQTCGPQVHVAAYTMPAGTAASYLGTRAVGAEAGSGKAVELTLSLTQERTLKHQIAARTKTVHASKLSESLSDSALTLALKSSAKLLDRLPLTLVASHPVLNAAQQAFNLAQFKSNFAKDFLDTSWGGGTALQLSAGAGFDYEQLYRFVSAVIARGNPENRPIYFTPDFDARPVHDADGHPVSPYQIAKSLIPQTNIVGDKIIGKSTFVVSSVIGSLEATLDALKLPNTKNVPVTILGCQGNIGQGVLNHLLEQGFTDVAVSDRALSVEAKIELEQQGVAVLPAPQDALDSAQFRPGINLIAYSNKAVPYGLADCAPQGLPDNSIILTASNNMLPSMAATAEYASALAEKNTVFLPGTLLTTGGQYTAVADRVLSDLADKPKFSWLLEPSGEHYVLPVKDALRALNHAMLYAQTQDALAFVSAENGDPSHVDAKTGNLEPLERGTIDFEKLRDQMVLRVDGTV